MTNQISYKRVYLADGEGVSYEFLDKELINKFDEIIPTDKPKQEAKKT